MRANLRILTAAAFFITFSVSIIQGATGDKIHEITVPVSGSTAYCSVGLAFDGTNLYYDRCGDQNIYQINPLTGALQDTIPSGISELPNALAYDKTRNGIWIASQSCNVSGMPIHFWDLDDNSFVLAFTIPFGLLNPATGQSFLSFCFTDGLAFDANEPTNPNDDELWFSDDVNHNIGVFKTNGTFVRGLDGITVDSSLVFTSGLALGGDHLYLANNGGGDVFRANKATAPLSLLDQFTNGDARQEDMECDPLTFSPTEVMWVRTTPQGGQFPDVITAYEIESGSCGTGGGPADTDGDGLYDQWEISGYDFDGDGSVDVDLPAMGADPFRKDVFVEIDWMDALLHDHRPDEQAIQLIVDAFNSAPVPNPSGRPDGINLHVDFGEGTFGAFAEGEAIPHQEFLGAFVDEQYDWADFEAIKDQYLSAERRPVFHYVVFAHSINNAGTSGISRDIPSSDFIVSLGGSFWSQLFGDRVARRNAEAGTFMHELGHNLDLQHGGNEGRNYKPNYLSVMNYAFQFRGLLVDGLEGHFDYSRFFDGVPVLDENGLNEADGLMGGGIPASYGTRKFNCDVGNPSYIPVLDANGPIDWNCNGSIDEGTVQANVNGNSFPPGNHFITGEQLVSWPDWMKLRFDGGLIGLGDAADALPMKTEGEEMTPEDALTVVPVAVTVGVDIKPGRGPNCVNPTSNGNIAVVILGGSINVANVAIESVQIDDDEDPATPGVSPDKWFFDSDVNKDKIDDLVLHFRTTEMNNAGLFTDGNILYVTAELMDRTPILGADQVFLAGGPSCF